mmetsp:Transcript_30583/g.71440  ORF Transcript_30583/g.71440 Transcript_30583/m.71440 type:complete len:193 (+) Transcript_30583:68-646(+)
MGCCESCASSRRKDASRRLSFKLQHRCSADELRAAIADAESCGVGGSESLLARQQFCELAKQERQSTENLEEMLTCALHMQDGIMLNAVLADAKHLHVELEASSQLLALMARARKLLAELQDDEMRKLWRMASFADADTFASQLDHARSIGVSKTELTWAQKRLKELPKVDKLGPSYSATADAIRRKSAPAS